MRWRTFGVADLLPLAVLALVAQLVNELCMALFYYFDGRDARALFKPVYTVMDLVFVPAGVLAALLYSAGEPATFALFMVLMAVFVLSVHGIGRALTAVDAEQSPFARLFKAGPPPDRTLVFALWTAEERGLLGSEHYATHPIYPVAKTAVNLTLDILQTAGPANDVILVGAGNTSLDALLAEAAKAQGRNRVCVAAPATDPTDAVGAVGAVGATQAALPSG